MGRQAFAWRRLLGWLAATSVMWVAGGAPLAAAGAVLTAWHLWRPPRPRTLLAMSAVSFGLVPVLWVAGNADSLGAVSPDLVLGNRLPGWVAAVGLTLLVVGIWRDDSVLASPSRIGAGS